ncbi:MAG: TolC family protein [Sphingomonas sp.]|uniref:TolC family protein n=1 Tax=Sphingomonas sp. TaxID=28214 RepID=UPI002272D60F|nr:TolC family protein [Sphingomonas sp.]MCX8476355.1 TolC family protein [Sphingomonas sp.]
MRIEAAFLACALLCAPHPALAQARAVSPVAGVPSPSGVRPSQLDRPVAVSLVEAVAIGVRDNRDIRAAFLDRAAQRFRLRAAERRFAPRLDLLADVYREDLAGTVTHQASLSGVGSLLLPSGAQIGFVWDRRQRLDGRGDSNVATLAVTQPLLRGGGFAVNRAPLRIARLQDSIERLALRNTLAEGISRIVFAYRALQQAQEQVRLAELALARTGELIATNRALIDAGRMAAADIVQSEADQANQQVALLQVRQQRNSTQLALLQQLALDPATNIVAADPIAAEQVPVDTQRAIAIARAGRMDLLAQQRAVEQAREGLRIARNQRLWDLSVVATATRNAGRDPLLGPLPSATDNRVGLQLAIPLGDPAPKLAVVEADTSLRTAELRLEALDQAVESQVRDAAQRVEAAWFQVEAARRFKTLSARAVEIGRDKLAAGRSSNFEVLSLQDALRAAEIQELAAIIAYLDALTSFDLQIGATLESWNVEWSGE